MLDENPHYEPYKLPWGQGGVSWERNIPIQDEVVNPWKKTPHY